jgi:hypothetical protein
MKNRKKDRLKKGHRLIEILRMRDLFFLTRTVEAILREAKNKTLQMATLKPQ